MQLEIGKRYRFSFVSGLEEEGTVVDILAHPDVLPVFKIKFDESSTGVRVVRVDRISHAFPIDAPGPMIVPDILLSPTKRPLSERARNWVTKILKR